MASAVVGEQYEKIRGQFATIEAQLRQNGGYPFSVNALVHHLQQAIEGNFPGFGGNISIWRTIRREPEASPEFYVRTLHERNVHINHAMQLLLLYMDSAYRSEPDAIRLVRVTGHDLGWLKGGTYPLFSQIRAKARQRGLRAVPNWVAPQLACEYDQPSGETLYFGAMPRQTREHEWISRVTLHWTGEGSVIKRSLQASAYTCSPDMQFSPNHVFIFSAGQ